ncbi:SCAN domain-containing protein 3-like [Bemisia tabaci]|uniref:SCAN domain-containing protein 3-like n=1 Tax=Bemisia tabaci TaxID=7038 RepID=UPI003B288282
MATANVNFELFLRSFINEDSEKNQLHVIPREQYSDLINEVKAARSARNKTPQQKRRVRRFNVIEIGGIEKLVKATGTDDIVYFVPLEEVYGTIEATHAAIGHGGRDRLKAELGRKYANITRPMIEKFLGMCEVCAGKKTKRKRGLVTKPILHKQLNSRCQVDLVDMQSQEIQGKRFILNYQDHLTKFIQLRALSHKTAEEVAAHLKDIFLTFGAPCILHSDNGREFVNNIIKCMKIHWPELQLVNGKPRHSQSQGSIERANQDVENMLAAWLIDKKTNQWPDALPFIQFMKNRAYHAGIRMSPYEALFGMKPRVGLTTSSLTPDMLANVETEEQLEELLASSQVNEENDEENDENEPVTTSAGNTTQTQPPQLSPVTTSAGNTTQTQPPQLSPVATSAGNTTQTQPPQLSPVTTSAGNTTQTQPPQLSPVATSAGNTTQTQPPQLSPVTTSAGNVCQSCGADLDTTEEKPEGEHEVLCGNCATRKNIRKARSQAAAGLEQQAKKMRLHSDKTHPPAKVGDNVTIPIPDVDKPRACLRNIIGVILDKNEHELYKIGTKDGILPKRYCRSEFDVCATAFISVSEVPAEKKVTVRAAAASVAGGSAQGFERCNCKKGCTSNQCKCRKNGKLCNSKCHSSLSCNNK